MLHAGQFLAAIHSDYFQKLILYVSKSIAANTIYSLMSKTWISLQDKNIPVYIEENPWSANSVKSHYDTTMLVTDGSKLMAIDAN